MEQLGKVFKLLGDPTRLRIFDLLMTGVHCNCEIAEQTGLSLNLISYHLKLLAEANLVLAERNPADARWIHYTINQSQIKKHQQLIDKTFDLSRFRERKPNCPPSNTSQKGEKDE